MCEHICRFINWVRFSVPRRRISGDEADLAAVVSVGELAELMEGDCRWRELKTPSGEVVVEFVGYDGRAFTVKGV